MCLILLEKEPVFVSGLVERNEIKFYFTSIVLNQWHSKSSPFHYKYRKNVPLPILDHYANGDFENTSENNRLKAPHQSKGWTSSLSNAAPQFESDTSDTFDKATIHTYIESETARMTASGKVPWDAGVLKLYIELGSIRKVAKALEIPHTTVHESLKISYKDIRTRFNNGTL